MIIIDVEVNMKANAVVIGLVIGVFSGFFMKSFLIGWTFGVLGFILMNAFRHDKGEDEFDEKNDV